MATYLYVVIGALIAQLAILYLPFSKKQRGIYSAVLAVIWFFGACALGGEDCNKQNPHHLPVDFRYRIERNPEFKQSLMAMYNLTEAEIDAKQPFEEGPTLEKTVQILAVLPLLFAPLLLCVAINEYNEKETEKVNKGLFALCAVGTALLLSLYFGLKLTILPLYKKAFEKAKPSPALS